MLRCFRKDVNVQTLIKRLWFVSIQLYSRISLSFVVLLSVRYCSSLSPTPPRTAPTSPGFSHYDSGWLTASNTVVYTLTLPHYLLGCSEYTSSTTAIYLVDITGIHSYVRRKAVVASTLRKHTPRWRVQYPESNSLTGRHVRCCVTRETYFRRWQHRPAPYATMPY